MMNCLLFCDLYTTSFEILVCYDSSCGPGWQISRVRARSTQKRMKEDDIGLEHGSFSFFPFGALFCLTLFSFVAVRIYAIRHRYRDSNQNDRDIALILKGRMARGGIDEKEYHRLKELLTK